MLRVVQRAIIAPAMPTLAPGDKAPDFELPVRGKETARLSTALQRGPVVLLTYVFDFSPG
jgi:peroxiredoxin